MPKEGSVDKKMRSRERVLFISILMVFRKGGYLHENILLYSSEIESVDIIFLFMQIYFTQKSNQVCTYITI